MRYIYVRSKVESQPILIDLLRCKAWQDTVVATRKSV